jgi:hypothetical protein
MTLSLSFPAPSPSRRGSAENLRLCSSAWPRSRWGLSSTAGLDLCQRCPRAVADRRGVFSRPSRHFEGRRRASRLFWEWSMQRQ